MKIQNETLSSLDTDGETNHKNQSSGVHLFPLRFSSKQDVFDCKREAKSLIYIVAELLVTSMLTLKWSLSKLWNYITVLYYRVLNISEIYWHESFNVAKNHKFALKWLKFYSTGCHLSFHLPREQWKTLNEKKRKKPQDEQQKNNSGDRQTCNRYWEAETEWLIF